MMTLCMMTKQQHSILPTSSSPPKQYISNNEQQCTSSCSWCTMMGTNGIIHTYYLAGWWVCLTVCWKVSCKQKRMKQRKDGNEALGCSHVFFSIIVYHCLLVYYHLSLSATMAACSGGAVVIFCTGDDQCASNCLLVAGFGC